jgi:hypothetical protein
MYIFQTQELFKENVGDALRMTRNSAACERRRIRTNRIIQGISHTRGSTFRWRTSCIPPSTTSSLAHSDTKTFLSQCYKRCDCPRSWTWARRTKDALATPRTCGRRRYRLHESFQHNSVSCKYSNISGEPCKCISTSRDVRTWNLWRHSKQRTGDSESRTSQASATSNCDVGTLSHPGGKATIPGRTANDSFLRNSRHPMKVVVGENIIKNREMTRLQSKLAVGPGGSTTEYYFVSIRTMPA